MRLKGLAIALIVSILPMQAAFAEDWKVTGGAHGFAQDPTADLARIGMTITDRDGAPVKGLSGSEFATYAVCGALSQKAEFVSLQSIDATHSPVQGEGDYILTVKAFAKINECDGFIVKVIARGTPAVPSFRQRVSVFIPIIR